LAILSLKSGELDFIQKDSWDIEIAKLSKDQKNLFVVRNVEGQSKLEHYSFPSLKRLSTKFKSAGVISSVDYSNKQKALIIGYWSPTESKNFYRVSLKNKKTERLTDTWSSIIPESSMIHPKSVWFESQGQKIHSWLFLPKANKRSLKKNVKAPVIVWPHGGPQWQERAQFRPIFQYFLSKGFAIWAPNPTGSTGYGISFCKKIERAWGTADLPDMLNGISWLKNSGLIDPEKMVIMGGSYGGYMTLRAITKIPNTFKAAVDLFGVSNLLTFATNIPEDWKFFVEKLVGNPIQDRDMLMEQSPVNYLDKVDCPLLVVQGGRDPRVVKSESDQVVEKLKSMKKEVEYLVFEDEGHGFFKPENELAAYKKAAEFLELHVGLK
jgi:dipeptidyl aminopeptidase/acylaminoacyl peptidase